MYISFDEGGSWQRFQLNLPLVPITDLAIKNDDLIVATQGRSFWVLDDLTLHQLRPEVAKEPLHLFGPRAAYRMPSFGGRGPASRTEGQLRNRNLTRVRFGLQLACERIGYGYRQRHRSFPTGPCKRS